ncbi:MAG: RadC family protein [Thermodesulfobacteriota bacterium]
MDQKNEKPFYHGHRQRLRDRFLKDGFKGFAPHEIVEILLTLAIPRRDVKKAAHKLMDRFGSVKGVLDAPVSELKEVLRQSQVAPVALKIIRETADLYLQQKAEEQVSLSTPEALHDFWRSRIGSLTYETFQVAYLDSGYRLLKDGIDTLEEGTIDRAAVYPRRVMDAALRRNAAALVFAHNHPNGNINPSERDKVLTRALILAAETLQIKVIDHVIVSNDMVLSFRKEGLI